MPETRGCAGMCQWRFNRDETTRIELTNLNATDARAASSTLNLTPTRTMGTLPRWILFNIFVLVAVALDLGVFHRRPHKIRLREAAAMERRVGDASVLFGVGVFWFLGRQPALEFFTGYLIEKALSIDNLFLFLVIFRAFHVDERVQHRLLAWGVLGALIMRGTMIALGAALMERFAWIMYVFGAFLVYAGIHMLVSRERGNASRRRTRFFKFASRHLRVTRQYHGENIFL